MFLLHFRNVLYKHLFQFTFNKFHLIYNKLCASIICITVGDRKFKFQERNTDAIGL